MERGGREKTEVCVRNEESQPWHYMWPSFCRRKTSHKSVVFKLFCNSLQPCLSKPIPEWRITGPIPELLDHRLKSNVTPSGTRTQSLGSADPPGVCGVTGWGRWEREGENNLERGVVFTVLASTCSEQGKPVFCLKNYWATMLVHFQRHRIITGYRNTMCSDQTSIMSIAVSLVLIIALC